MPGLDALVKLLDLETIEVNLFRGASPHDNRDRVFGGQVAGQALVAAVRTVDVPGRTVHSLHAYFLRPGDPNVPILYQVDRVRDGKSFSTRRVLAVQHGRAIFNMQASFHEQETGLDYQPPAPLDVVAADEIPDFTERMKPHKARLGLDEWYHRWRPIDIRHIDGDPFLRDGNPSFGQRVWLRADGVLPDDPTLHACVVTYASDMTLLSTPLLPFGLAPWSPGMQSASLDHAMWFHRPFRADEWLLYDQRPVSTAAARGLAEGHIYTKDGTLVVTVLQEGLVRMPQS